MKKILLSVLVTVLIVLSCSDRDDELLNANIRINNRSDLDFTSVQVRVDSLRFDDVLAGDFSDYLPFEAAFAADTITVFTDSLEFTFIPLDSIFGDTLPIGLYTYELSFSEENELELNFRVD